MTNSWNSLFTAVQNWWNEWWKEYRSEIRIVFDLDNTGERKTRFEQWEKHVKKFATIKNDKDHPWQATRIEFTAWHLVSCN
jgi:hypothetical protein